MRYANRGYKYFCSALKIAAGAGAVFGGSYILSRIKEKQDAEARLDRLEQMLDRFSAAETTPDRQEFPDRQEY